MTHGQAVSDGRIARRLKLGFLAGTIIGGGGVLTAQAQAAASVPAPAESVPAQTAAAVPAPAATDAAAVGASRDAEMVVTG